ncbi:hypothetical protein CEXT_530761 [Caerostris extrusa]|uniref:Uncharacterized protein n=1 Tax=Caerostris extrusa TaxID=172846 RepID=A0AAV4WS82_CAEEX|nr:hypothetical protein CEXT_530761 [Caerostris extrusa]
MKLVATIDYSLRGSAPGASNQPMINPELMDTTLFRTTRCKLRMEGNQISAEKQARINCEGLRHSIKQLDAHKKLFLQVKETYQADV